jgi:hypothetical protein
MCEVEFWEVFVRTKVRRFLESGALLPLADCQIADLECEFFRLLNC